MPSTERTTGAEAGPLLAMGVGTPAERESVFPWVSIVVPTYNRAETLRDTLHALQAQDYPAGCMDIVVVDNSSTDATDDVMRAARCHSRFEISFYRKENRGPAASRNFGAARARGEILAFTDSDCTMRPDWVSNAVRRIKEGADLVTGPVHPIVNPRRIPGFWHHQTDHSRPNTIYPTANVFYRRDVFQHVGGFDERFGAYPWGTPVGGEDIDLAWRAIRAGFRADWVHDAPVFHEASSMPFRAWLIEPIRAQLMPRLVASIPELRAELIWSIFISTESLAFYPAMAGLAVAAKTRRISALSALLPWLWLMRSMVERDLWPPRRWWRIPAKYGLSAVRAGVQVAALGWASARYRSLVL